MENQTMPSVHEMGGNAQPVASSEEHCSSRRYPNQNTDNMHTEEHPTFIPQSEDRCTVFFLTLGIDSRVFLVPYYLQQASEGSNSSGPTADTSLDFIQLSEGNSTSAQLHPRSGESSMASGSSLPSILGKPDKKRKQAKTTKRSPTTSQARAALDTSPVSDCEDFDVAASLLLINNIPKEENQVRRISRRKRKKKGKQSKRSTPKSISDQLGTQRVGDTCSANSELLHLASEIMCSTSMVSTSVSHPNENGICETSSSDDQHSSSSEPSSFPNMKEDAFAKGKNESNSSEEGWSLISTGNISTQSTMDYCCRSEMSTCCSTTNSSNERAQCNSQASTSDEFQPVLRRRRRQGRETSRNSINLHGPFSTNMHAWPAIHGQNIRTKNSNIDSHHAGIFSKVSERRERSGEGKLCKQESGTSASSLPSDEKVTETAETNRARLSEGSVMMERDEIPLERTNQQQIGIQVDSLSVNEFGNLGCLQDTQIGQKIPEKIYTAVSNTSQQDAEFQPVVCRRRRRQGRVASGNSNDLHRSSIANLHCRSAKCGHNVRSKNSNLDSHHVGIFSKVSERQERSDEGKLCEQKESETSTSRLCSDEKVIKTAEVSMARLSNDNAQMIGGEIPLQRTTNQQQIGIQLNSLSITEFGNVGSMQDEQIDSEEENLEEKICVAASNASDQVAQNEIESLLTESDLLAKSQTNVHNSGYMIDGEDSEKIELEAERLNQSVPEADVLNLRSGSQPSTMENTSSLLDEKTQSFAGCMTDLYKIMQAVVESGKLLIASEAIQLMTGSPLAAFERVLYSASPSLGQTNLSLGSLWQWYERPGSFGLEVKVEGCNIPKSSLDCCSPFRAYFVPYLSAVQLFGGSITPLLNSGLHKGRELVPVAEDEVNDQPVGKNTFADEELLFEYFETAQPQRRRPLLQKIKELARGDTSSNCQMFGDPSLLQILNLHHLHSASWFSVAWYPIYRIPDGNFRAAFLTYHSLGHSVLQSTPSDEICGSKKVFPVVGMQSYKAKGEGWFQKSSFSANEEAMIPNPSTTFSERLRTLEKTASVMATATVRKDNQWSANKHSDYAYFTRWW